MSADESTPADVLQREGLKEAVTALTNLILVQPRESVVRATIELAMTMGVHAGEKRQARGEGHANTEELLRSIRPLTFANYYSRSGQPGEDITK